MKLPPSAAFTRTSGGASSASNAETPGAPTAITDCGASGRSTTITRRGCAPAPRPSSLVGPSIGAGAASAAASTHANVVSSIGVELGARDVADDDEGRAIGAPVRRVELLHVVERRPSRPTSSVPFVGCAVRVARRDRPCARRRRRATASGSLWRAACRSFFQRSCTRFHSTGAKRAASSTTSPKIAAAGAEVLLQDRELRERVVGVRARSGASRRGDRCRARSRARRACPRPRRACSPSCARGRPCPSGSLRRARRDDELHRDDRQRVPLEEPHRQAVRALVLDRAPAA